jgi:hypothetical protein
VIDKAVSGVALVFQVTGGFGIGTVIAQTASPGLDPALVSAYGAISALFGLLTWMAKGRIERCEKREDKILDTAGEQTGTMRELAAAVNKAADVTGDAVEATSKSADELKMVSGKLDTALGTITKLENKIDNELAGMRREIERFNNGPPSIK